MIQAQITRGGFELLARDSSTRVGGIIQFNGERVHIDIPVRTIVGALAAADAPILNDHLERIAPANGADRAAHHA